MLNNDQLKGYLLRIGLEENWFESIADDGTVGLASTSVNNKIEALKRIQEAHMLRVPFENFDVFAGRPIVRNIAELYNKVIVRKRGGYCFELNTLHGALLSTLGYKIKAVLARVLLRNPEELPPRNHLVHLVEIDGETWLTDVGFGGLASRIPLKLNESDPVFDGDGYIRLLPQGERQILVQRKVAEEWQPQYVFETSEAIASDIEVANFYVQHHPESHFVNHRFIGLFTKKGRIGLFDNAFSERHGLEVVQKSTVNDGPEWIRLLTDKFHLQLNDSELSTKLQYPKPSRLD